MLTQAGGWSVSSGRRRCTSRSCRSTSPSSTTSSGTSATPCPRCDALFSPPHVLRKTCRIVGLLRHGPGHLKSAPRSSAPLHMHASYLPPRQCCRSSSHTCILSAHFDLTTLSLSFFSSVQSQFPDGRLPTSPRQLKILLQRPPINTAPMYTMLSRLPDRQLVSDFIVKVKRQTH